ncbi:MAG: hypothetical protein A4E35_01598 [Methanoregula sp. PtaU1.Bin051]|nr:MAG: hypothetical protein A4E35_01598 [Methanoregula sp. PtaU1.Bin051]
MTEKHANEDVEVVVLPGATRKTYSAADRRKIQNVIKDKLLLTSMEPYHKVQVTVKHRPDGSPESLLATMLRAHTYTADIVKVNVDKDYNVKSIERSPKEE